MMNYGGHLFAFLKVSVKRMWITLLLISLCNSLFGLWLCQLSQEKNLKLIIKLLVFWLVIPKPNNHFLLERLFVFFICLNYELSRSGVQYSNIDNSEFN